MKLDKKDIEAVALDRIQTHYYKTFVVSVLFPTLFLIIVVAASDALTTIPTSLQIFVCSFLYIWAFSVVILTYRVAMDTKKLTKRLMNEEGLSDKKASGTA